MDDLSQVPGCSLPATDLADRRAAWALVEPAVTARDGTAGGFQLRFRPDPGVLDSLRALVDAERACCGWATWHLVDGTDAIVLDVAGPPDRIAGLATAVGVTPADDGLGIGEVARRSGVPASTLRYYEEVGLLPSPRRVSGRRRYDPSVLDRLVVITAARGARFTLADVRQLLDAMAAGPTAGDGWRAVSGRKRREVDDLLRQLHAVRSLLDALAACGCADEAACAAALRAGGGDATKPGRPASVR